MNSVSPHSIHPIHLSDELVFLKNCIQPESNVEIGDFTYYHDIHGAKDFQKNNVLYHHPDLNDKLVIGKFCSIAMGARFLMGGATHESVGSTYPFEIFDPTWAAIMGNNLPYTSKGDTLIGNDVWLGLGCTIMPGINIGHGAIIGSCAVITKDVPDYAVAAGNPAKIIKMRYPEDVIHDFLKVSWWDWSIELITKHLHDIKKGNVKKLLSVNPS